MYNQAQNEINISKVSNGWIVCLPDEIQDIMQLQEDSIRNQVRILKEEMTGDDLLKSLQKGDEEPVIQTDNRTQLQKDATTFIFATFPEVLEFLKSKINPNE